MFSTKDRSSTSGFARFFRIITAVVVITAFVLGVSYTVKQLYDFKLTVFAEKADPYLGKVGLSTTKLGEVAGLLTKRIDDNVNTPEIKRNTHESSSSVSNENDSLNELGKFAVFSDIEGKNDSLKKLLGILNETGISNAIILGDLTSYGDVESLSEVRGILESSGLNYYAVPGDHDLAASVEDGDTSGLANYKKIFGDIKTNAVIFGKKIILVNNSANHTVIDPETVRLFESNVGGADFIAMAQPLYNPILSRSMGVIDGVEDTAVKEQADSMLSFIRQSKVAGIFSGDIHMSGDYVDPIRSSLHHYFVGSVTDTPSLPSPSFSIVTVYGDGRFNVEAIELN